MSDAFELAMPWWQFVLRAGSVYLVLLLMIRLSGKRTMGQFTPFDMLLIVLLGNAVQNALLGRDVSVLGGLLLAATLIALHWLVGLVSARSDSAGRLIEGEPVVLARHGQLFARVLQRELVSQNDLEEAMRQADCAGIEEVELALLETNGQISIVKREGGKSKHR